MIGFFIQLNCQYTELCSAAYAIKNPKNQSDFSNLWMKTINENQNKYNQIDLTLKPKDVEQMELVIT